MPVRYASELAEHHAVRTAAGLFDISHMAEFVVSGAAAANFLDYALAGKLSALAVGKARYSLILTAHGGVLDDVIVYRLEDDRYLVISNAGNRSEVAEAFEKRRGEFAAADQVTVADISDETALIAVQGPVARAVLEATDGLRGIDPGLDALSYYAWSAAVFGDEPVLIARTGYTGEDGFELLVTAEIAGQLWDALLQAGAPLGLVPAGLAARDTLRLEAGMPLHGHELSADIRPEQAGLTRVVARDKADFVGKEAPAAPEGAPVLVGLVSEGRRAGRAGYAVRDAAGTPVGEITSGALSPTLGYPIALALVDPASAAPGTDLAIDVRGTLIAATVTALPFYRRTS